MVASANIYGSMPAIVSGTLPWWYGLPSKGLMI